jgi:hypothetical protein
VNLDKELKMPSPNIMSLAIGRLAGKNAGVPPENLGKSAAESPTSTTKTKALQKVEDGKPKKIK